MKLIVVTNDQLPVRQLTEVLLAIEPYVDAVILREKSKTEKDLANLLARLKESLFPIRKIIVHANPALAHTHDVPTVQLPGNGPSPNVLKKTFPNLSFGKSVHSLEEAKQAAKEGSQSVLYGHIFPTDSKKGVPPRGIVELEKIVQSVDIPVYAIGGIEPQHIPLLRNINVSGIAILSPVFNHPDPAFIAKKYYEAIHKGVFTS